MRFPSLALSLLVPMLALAAGAGAAPRRASMPTTESRIPVLAWHSIPPEHTTLERYRELADCGFTESFSFFQNVDQVARALDVGKETGIKVYVACPELAQDPEGIARRFKDHPAIAGYHLQDEPTAADFPRLAAWAKRIQAVDPKHPCYINLLPTYASPGQLGRPNYQAYLDTYLSEVPVPFLSWDNYPVVGKQLRGDFYENLELAAATAQKKGLPTWAFYLAVAHDPYPIATLAHMRLQAFSNLAYGVQTIQVFTYWNPAENPIWNFHQAPIERDGSKTIVYNRVQKVNREIRALSPVFLGAKVVKVGHTGTLPKGAQAYAAEAPISGVETEGKGAVVSVLENGGRRYLALVNRDFNQTLPLTVTLDGSKRITEIDKEGGSTPVSGKRWQRTLEPGDMAILSWQK